MLVQPTVDRAAEHLAEISYVMTFGVALEMVIQLRHQVRAEGRLRTDAAAWRQQMEVIWRMRDDAVELADTDLPELFLQLAKVHAMIADKVHAAANRLFGDVENQTAAISSLQLVARTSFEQLDQIMHRWPDGRFDLPGVKP